MPPTETRVLRQMQPSGHYLPINSTFPSVKGVEGCTLPAKRAASGQAHQLDAQVKRSKVDGLARASSQAVDELLGRPAGAADVTNPPSILLPHQGVLSARVPDAANMGGPAATSMGPAVTTFLDIAQATNMADAADGKALATHKSSLMSLRLPCNASRPPLAPTGTGTLDHAAGLQAPSAAGTAGAAGSSSAPQQPEVVVLQCLPYDWALKASARLTTAGRFACYDLSTCASAKHDTCCPRQPWAHLPLQERWLLGLTSWRHPAPDTSLSPAAIAALSAAAPEVLAARLDAWRVALASAYMAVRHRQAPALYVDSPQGARQPCTVLFTAAGVRGCAQPQALVSCSSAQQRSRMHTAGLEFVMPLAPHQQQPSTAEAAQKAAADPMAMDMEEGAREPGSAAPLPQVKDWSPQSLLQFQGGVQVHLLFDWLLQEVGFSVQQGGEAADVPLLLAPAPFKGACVCRPEIKSMYGQGPAAPVAGELQQQQQQHVLEVSGPLPPWTLTRMCSALAEASVPHSQSFQLDLVTPPHTLALNVWSHPAGSGGGSQGAGAQVASRQVGPAAGAAWELAPEEGGAARDAPAWLCRRVLHRALVQPAASQLGGDSSGAVGSLRAQYCLKLSG